MKDDPISSLARLLARLPGVGAKSGARMAYFVWRAPERYARELARAIDDVKDRAHACAVCGAPDLESPCRICRDPERDHATIMVVEEPQDLDAIEAVGHYAGTYHVLGGTLSPIAGRGPEDLAVQRLLERALAPEVGELILATNPSVEGDATAAYLEERLACLRDGLAVTRLGRGLPIGAEIKYLDAQSIGHAISGRKKTDPAGRP